MKKSIAVAVTVGVLVALAVLAAICRSGDPRPSAGGITPRPEAARQETPAAPARASKSPGIAPPHAGSSPPMKEQPPPSLKITSTIAGTTQGAFDHVVVSASSDSTQVQVLAEQFLRLAGYGDVFRVAAVTWKGDYHQFWQVRLEDPGKPGHTGVLNIYPSGKIEIHDHGKMPPPS
jgi:hypothetical protein